MNIFFDVDLTIVSAGYELRPYTREVITALKEAGHQVYIWSMGGEEFARQMVERHNLDHVVDGVFSKQDEIGIWPDFCVDDEAHYVDTYGGHQVGRYMMHSDHDFEMLQVLQNFREVDEEEEAEE